MCVCVCVCVCKKDAITDRSIFQQKKSHLNDTKFFIEYFEKNIDIYKT